MQTETGSTTDFAAMTVGEIPRKNRQLPERILVAAHQACDLGDLEVAGRLLSAVQGLITQGTKSDPATRRAMEGVAAAHHRIWNLRHGSDHKRPVRLANSEVTPIWQASAA